MIRFTGPRTIRSSCRTTSPRVVRRRSEADIDMIRRTVTVTLENGLHMVPASTIAKAARDFRGHVVLRHDQITADARSVLDLLQLKAECGVVLELEADGDGEADLVNAIAELFATNFAAAHRSEGPGAGTRAP